MAERDTLRDLGARVRDAVSAHVQGHAQVSAECEVRGIRERTTLARLAVRVGDWHASARVVLDEHDTGRAARECVDALRARITARLAWHETMERACRAALGVMGDG